MLSTVGPEGMETLRNRPERVKAVSEEVEKMGARVVTQYALFGQYDFLTVLEAPDENTMAKVAVELGARGTMKTLTLAAMPVDEFINVLKELG
jgi:uncharacterized protein with GYD domain